MIHNISDETIAHIIRDYWKQRGYDVKADVRDCARLDMAGHVIVTYRGVRSNLLNAMPRGYSGELGVKG